MTNSSFTGQYKLLPRKWGICHWSTHINLPYLKIYIFSYVCDDVMNMNNAEVYVCANQMPFYRNIADVLMHIDLNLRGVHITTIKHHKKIRS